MLSMWKKLNLSDLLETKTIKNMQTKKKKTNLKIIQNKSHSNNTHKTHTNTKYKLSMEKKHQKEQRIDLIGFILYY